jgi:hypothetical protein
MDEKAWRCDTSLEAEFRRIGSGRRKWRWPVEFSVSENPMCSSCACSSGRNVCLAEQGFFGESHVSTSDHVSL